ncbi:biopolymer transporter ExbD [Kamptonema cortianum]|nr:biopolymer transporter ExbD [Oscillatoria laete-virens]MDK3160218.1 biopolymer transporter ExbD [Kamptonema cortianum]MDL5048428.1 biopolymer transporter ExbD [Oscillatoria amoena NRMC-F 0135]MDL5055661.1 biopolymer transporter ExbD [Oscillatoria laete-virens NRMC-F 0139]
MNFRKKNHYDPLMLQLAPMIDVILFLLTFFLLTWNAARYENELDIKIPTASASRESQSPFDTVVLNVRQDGAIILNRRVVEPAELQKILAELSKQFPNQSVIIRAGENTEYRLIIDTLNICREADIWNVAFATMPAGQQE